MNDQTQHTSMTPAGAASVLMDGLAPVRTKEKSMWQVQYKSILSGKWVGSHLGVYSSEIRAKNAGSKEFEGRYEWRVVPA